MSDDLTPEEEAEIDQVVQETMTDLGRIWGSAIKAQMLAPSVLESFVQRQPPTPEQIEERRQRQERDEALLAGFMEHYRALADRYGVTVVGGDGGDVWFQLGTATEDV